MYGLEKGIIPMLIMLAASVPLYMCASASTPIAAALIVKGISPGAAMVFLLAGPATNVTTIVMLTKQFGGRFVRDLFSMYYCRCSDIRIRFRLSVDSFRNAYCTIYEHG